MLNTQNLLRLVVFTILFGATALAQDSPPQKLTLDQAVELAMKNYPAIRAAKAQSQSAEAGIESAKTALLPRADLLWQQNRATRNNVFGLLLPQSTIPGISGPVQGATTQESAWGSAAGLLFSWEPFDFGLRKAGIDFIDGDSAIVPVMLYDAKLSQIMADELLKKGIYVIGFFFPVVAKGKARIRVQISAAHEQNHLDKAIQAFTEVGKELGVLK